MASTSTPDGVQGLDEGAEALADGLTQLYDSGTALADGANALRDGLSAVSGAVGGMTSGDTGSNDEMMAQLNEQLAPVISNYGTTVVTDTVTDADLLAALTAAGLTGSSSRPYWRSRRGHGQSAAKRHSAMVQGVAVRSPGSSWASLAAASASCKPAWTSLPAAVPSWPAVPTPT